MECRERNGGCAGKGWFLERFELRLRLSNECVDLLRSMARVPRVNGTRRKKGSGTSTFMANTATHCKVAWKPDFRPGVCKGFRVHHRTIQCKTGVKCASASCVRHCGGDLRQLRYIPATESLDWEQGSLRRSSACGTIHVREANVDAQWYVVMFVYPPYHNQMS